MQEDKETYYTNCIIIVKLLMVELMGIEEKITSKFKELIESAKGLENSAGGRPRNANHRNRCIAWLASAQNIVHLAVSNPSNPYRNSVDNICSDNERYDSHNCVGEVSNIMTSLLQDIDQGLLASIEDQTRATVFDDFLDHAKEYVKQKLKKEAGVISGVVFEDTLRSICRNLDIEEKGAKLDILINELVKVGALSQLKAKRARVAAHVRTKATHAEWDEFDLKDVNTTIEFTEELILKHLGE